MKKHFLYALTALLLSTTSLHAQEVKDLKVDNSSNHADRKEMLDVLRARMKSRYKVTCTYSVKHFKMTDGWAWLLAETQSENFSAIKFSEDEFVDCCHVEALFQKVKGKWYIADYGAFSTDVWWWGIADRHPKAPKGIFDEAGLLK